VFSLKRDGNGTLLAGTNRGLFVLDRTSKVWRACADKSKRTPAQVKSRKIPVTPSSVTQTLMNAKVNDIELSSGKWLVATSEGLYSSDNDGKSWSGGPVLGRRDLVAVASTPGLIATATRTEVLISADEGANWEFAALGGQTTSIRGLALTPDKQILLASREGAFRSTDSGKTWEHVLNGLPDRDLSSISYDDSARILLATSFSTSVIFLSEDQGRSWSKGPDTGYPLRRVKLAKGRFIGVTPFDGVITQE
jgi:hypothetical protein